MTRNLKPLFVLLLGASLILGACSRENPAATTPTVSPQPARTSAATRTPARQPTATEVVIQGTVAIWHSWDEPEIPALVQVIKDFQTLYPNVLFDVLYVPLQDLRARFETMAADGAGPTLLLGPAEWGPPLYNAGLIADLSDLAESDLLEGINRAALGTVQYRDALIGLPYSLEGVVLFRNGLIIPESPATFDDLVAMAKSATQGEIVGADLERSFYFSGGHLLGLGGQLMGPEGEPAFNDEKGLQWLELLQKFADAGPTEYLSERDIELFKGGQAGFIIDGTWNINNLAESIGPDNLSIDPWPAYGDGHLAGFVQPENLYLSAQAGGDRLTATWLFAQYLLSGEAQAILSEAGHIPAASGVQVTDRLMAEAMAALAGGATYPALPATPLYNTPMDIALQSVLNGGVQPADALQAAQDSILSAQSGVEATLAPAP